MKKMEKHKKCDHNKAPSFSLLPSKLKRCYTEMVPLNDEEHVEHYLKIREQKFNQIMCFEPKKVNVVKHEVTHVEQVKTERVSSSNETTPAKPVEIDSDISLDSDMKLNKALTNKNKDHSMTNTNKSNDRLVIELKDYLTLTKTKNIVKFKLKPIPDKPELSSVKDIIKTANTFQFKQILNYGQSYEEPQRTFLLVPQNKGDTINKGSKLYKKQVNGKKSRVVLSSELSSPVETFQKAEQTNHKKSNGKKSRVVLSSELSSPVETFKKTEQCNHKISKRKKSRVVPSSELINPVEPFQKAEQFNHKISKGKKSRVVLSSELSSPIGTFQKAEQFNHKESNGKKCRVVPSSELVGPVETFLSSPVGTFQKTEQINHKKSNIQLLNVQEDSTINICTKPVDTKQPEPKAQLPEKKSCPVITVSKKVQYNNIHSSTDNAIKPFTKARKKVILRSHPYFSKHKPFVIKHKPVVTNVIMHQNDSATNQQENLEIDLDSLFRNNELINDIKFEVPEHELNFAMLQESESINQIFPVALKSTDSHDFEYLGFETNNDVSTESEMQILGI